MVFFARVQDATVVNIEDVPVNVAAADPELILCPTEKVLPDGSFNAALIGSTYDSNTRIFTPPPMPPVDETS